MREYDYYLFDSDGTLTDTAELIYRCFNNTSKFYSNREVEREDVLNTIGMPLRPQMALFIGELSDEKYLEARDYHMEFQFKYFKEYLSLFKGTEEILKELRSRGKKLAVVTSRRRDSLEKYLKFVGIFDYFDVIVTPEDTEKHKPNPEPVLEALKQLNATKERSIFIGDATYDIEAGASAGVDTAFVEWSESDRSLFKIEATYTINNWDQLLQW